MSDLSDSDSSLRKDEAVFTVQEVLRTGLSTQASVSFITQRRKFGGQNVPQILTDSSVAMVCCLCVSSYKICKHDRLSTT